MKHHNKIQKSILYTLQCLASIYIALEVSTPPNPYKTEIIVILSLLIALKYDIPNKILLKVEELIEKPK